MTSFAVVCDVFDTIRFQSPTCNTEEKAFMVRQMEWVPELKVKWKFFRQYTTVQIESEAQK